jgi:hypothetical protein
MIGCAAVSHLDGLQRIFAVAASSRVKASGTLSSKSIAYTFSALLILLLVFQFILRLACGFIEPTNLFALNVEGKPGGSSC